jgi:hypothetical protein
MKHEKQKASLWCFHYTRCQPPLLQGMPTSGAQRQIGLYSCLERWLSASLLGLITIRCWLHYSPCELILLQLLSCDVATWTPALREWSLRC